MLAAVWRQRLEHFGIHWMPAFLQIFELVRHEGHRTFGAKSGGTKPASRSQQGFLVSIIGKRIASTVVDDETGVVLL